MDDARPRSQRQHDDDAQDRARNKGVRNRFLLDREGNRTYPENTVAEAKSTPVHLDELYSHEDLHRLSSMSRGQLVTGTRISSYAFSQFWLLDPTGNSRYFAEMDQSDASAAVFQKRSHNAANELTAIDTNFGDQ